MEKIPDLFKIKKKTINKVVLFHFIFIAILALQLRTSKSFPKKLSINHVTIKDPSAPPLKKQIVQKKIAPPLKKPPPLKRPSVSIKKDSQKKFEKKASLITTLEKQLQTLDKNQRDYEINKELKIPKNVKNLKNINIDHLINQNTKGNLDNINDKNNIKMLLVKELQDNLHLPEYGEVKVSFNIHPSGQIADVEIIDSQSDKNQKYLKNSLLELSFKSINKMFDQTQQFIVIFKNQ